MIIESSSRLHFGIIDISREFSRQYGALGVMIKGGFRIEITPVSDGLIVEGDEHVVREVKAVHQRLDSRYGLERGYRIKVLRQVPRHIGLGSTTQLHMGISMGILTAEGHQVRSGEIASVVGRSRYSAIGTHGFQHGGFILEGGKCGADDIPPMTARYDTPEDWRFVIVCPEDIKGYDEVQEKPILKRMKVDVDIARGISHHIVMGILPAISTGDIANFGLHLHRLQRLVGESFLPYQGGIFHPVIEDIIHELNDITYGAGQSSWGPTAYGLTHMDRADDVRGHIVDWLSEKGLDAHVWVAEPNNRGFRFIEG